jgi:hypothetical protein
MQSRVVVLQPCEFNASYFTNGNSTISANQSASFVNLAPVADVVEINAAKLHIEFVKHAVVAGAEFEFRTALQPFVRESFQPRSQFINLALHCFADTGRQIVKRFGKSRRPDLERGGHGSFWLASRVIAFRDFVAGLIKLGLHFVGEFKLVLKKIVNPRADFFNFGAGQFWNDSFNFLNRTHGNKDKPARIICKARIISQTATPQFSTDFHPPPFATAPSARHLCSLSRLKMSLLAELDLF